METQRAAIILAAGKSTRMKSARSKVLHPVAGRSMLSWVSALAYDVNVSDTVCVVGEANQDVRAAAEVAGHLIAVQEPQLGTAHAVLSAREFLSNFQGVVVVLYADTPLIQRDTIERVFDALDDGAHVAVLGFETDQPGAYGRLIEHNNELLAIVEAKEATPEQLNIKLCNSGVMAARAEDMLWALERVSNDNVKGEFYLTDIVENLRNAGKKAVAVRGQAHEVLGVNSREDLAQAEQAFQKAMRQTMLKKGVTLRDPDSIIFAFDTDIEADADIGAHVVFGPNVKIGHNVTIHPFCHIEGANIQSGAQIGPFARLRPGTELGAETKVGNFVETKKVKVGRGSKINHLSYIGDANVGANVNIGAGTITCNYDGYFKHITDIEDHVFVGTHSSLVAPVTIGEGAFLGSGGVITKDVPPHALALARAEQVHKDGWATRYHAAQKKRKSRTS